MEKRAVEIAEYVIETRATVRDTAKKFNISKTTVHIDLVARLPQIRPKLANDVRTVLNINKAERHIRGGLAIKTKKGTG